MIADPLHEILVLLFLAAGYALLGLVVWLVFCGGNAAAVRRLNAAIAARKGSVFSVEAAADNRAGSSCGAAPDLHATLAALVAERRIPSKLAERLRRIAPVFHDGQWVVYPSNAYWSHRFESLNSR